MWSRSSKMRRILVAGLCAIAAAIGLAAWVVSVRLWPDVRIGDAEGRVLEVLGEPDRRFQDQATLFQHVDHFAFSRAAGDVTEATGWFVVRYVRYRQARREQYYPHRASMPMPPFPDSVFLYRWWPNRCALVYLKDGRVARVLRGSF